jgi:hypothetical protein
VYFDSFSTRARALQELFADVLENEVLSEPAKAILHLSLRYSQGDQYRLSREEIQALFEGDQESEWYCYHYAVLYEPTEGE